MTNKSASTRGQQRAQKAFSLVNAAANNEWKDDYGRQCMHLPMLIQQSGLAQAIAFLESKASDEKKSAYFGCLLDDFTALVGKSANRTEFAQLVRSAPVSEYQWLVREALACATWMKRYAEAVLKASYEE
ncbi:MAG TPA: type III-B CRISPR module-associated protein Cmr5 [candidate division Zixibacteria bacterium]|nr:type III-B CRISPR module-associated protein Cmr5 [candidate division Zixibacteria bacterium]